MVAGQPAAEPAPAAGPLRPSLRARLLRDVMVPLALVWAAGTAVVLGVASFFAQQAYDRSLLDDAYMMAANVRQSGRGLELALYCDILIASENAKFADTHARVGLLPTWGLSVRLPQKVGVGMARRMSMTGDYLSATEALRAGLVTEVVAHDELLPTARRVAASIVGILIGLQGDMSTTAREPMLWVIALGLAIWAVSSVWALMVIGGVDHDLAHDEDSTLEHTVDPRDDELDPLEQIRGMR